MTFQFTRRALLAALALFASAEAYAQYPDKPVRIIVPYAAGGGGDQLTRALAQALGEIWKQSVVVDNRPGAGATIGTGAVAKSAPDGYVLLMTANTMAVSPAAYPNLPYDVVKDFAPITLLAQTPYVVTVNPKVPATTFEQFQRLAKASPGKLNYGSPGNGTLSHLAFELLRAATGIEATTVAYKGSNPAMLDALSGQVDFVLDTPAAIGQHVKAGTLRALAVTSGQRTPAMPGTPTVAESGVAGFDVTVWFGLMAPAGTPVDIVNKINADTRKALATPAMLAKLNAVGMDVITNSPAEFATLMGDDVRKWGDVIRKANIKFQ